MTTIHLSPFYQPREWCKKNITLSNPPPPQSSLSKKIFECVKRIFLFLVSLLILPVIEFCYRIHRYTLLRREGIQSVVGSLPTDAKVHFLSDIHTDVKMRQNRIDYINRMAKDGDIILEERATTKWAALVPDKCFQEAMKKSLDFYTWDDWSARFTHGRIAKLMLSSMDEMDSFYSSQDASLKRFKSDSNYSVIRSKIDRTVEVRQEILNLMTKARLQLNEIRERSLIKITKVFLELNPTRRIFVIAGEAHIENIQNQTQDMESACTVYWRDTGTHDRTSKEYFRLIATELDEPGATAVRKPPQASGSIDELNAVCDASLKNLVKYKKQMEQITKDIRSFCSNLKDQCEQIFPKFDGPCSLNKSKFPSDGNLYQMGPKTS